MTQRLGGKVARQWISMSPPHAATQARQRIGRDSTSAGSFSAFGLKKVPFLQMACANQQGPA